MWRTVRSIPRNCGIGSSSLNEGLACHVSEGIGRMCLENNDRTATNPQLMQSRIDQPKLLRPEDESHRNGTSLSKNQAKAIVPRVLPEEVAEEVQQWFRHEGSIRDVNASVWVPGLPTLGSSATPRWYRGCLYPSGFSSPCFQAMTEIVNSGDRVELKAVQRFSPPITLGETGLLRLRVPFHRRSEAARGRKRPGTAE